MYPCFTEAKIPNGHLLTQDNSLYHADMGKILKEGYYILPHIDIYIPPSFMSQVLRAQCPNGILAQTGQTSKRRDIILIYPPHTHTHTHTTTTTNTTIFSMPKFQWDKNLKGLYSLVQGICPQGTILAHTGQIPKNYTRSYKANAQRKDVV